MVKRPTQRRCMSQELEPDSRAEARALGNPRTALRAHAYGWPGKFDRALVHTLPVRTLAHLAARRLQDHVHFGDQAARAQDLLAPRLGLAQEVLHEQPPTPGDLAEHSTCAWKDIQHLA